MVDMVSPLHSWKHECSAEVSTSHHFVSTSKAKVLCDTSQVSLKRCCAAPLVINAV